MCKSITDPLSLLELSEGGFLCDLRVNYFSEGGLPEDFHRPLSLLLCLCSL